MMTRDELLQKVLDQLEYDEIEIGLHGSFNLPQMLVDMEKSGYHAGNNPGVRIATGLTLERGEIALAFGAAQVAERNMKGNKGRYIFRLSRFSGWAVFNITGAAESSGRIGNYTILAHRSEEGGQLTCGMRSLSRALEGAGVQLNDLAEALYPAQFAELSARAAREAKARDTTAKVLSEIESERVEIAKSELAEHDCAGLDIEVKFRSADPEAIERRVLRGDEPDEIVAELTLPTEYVCVNPFLRNTALPDLIQAAREELARRQQAAAQAAAKAEEMGLPELSGSPKQIAWALKLRAAFAEKNPGHPSLKRATTAKYWIDNRNG